MNPELPKNPREELELRLTALLLGELSDTEAAAVREAIAKDPELTRLHNELKQTIRLVRVAATGPEQPVTTEATQLKLSEERRKKLLTVFAIPPLKKEHRKPKAKFQVRLIEVLAVLVIVALLVAITMPNFVKSRTTAQSNAIINNLRQLDGAKQQWALEQKKSPDAIPTMEEVSAYLKGLSPVMGETYVLGKVSDSPFAELGRKQYRLPTGNETVVASVNGDKASDQLGDSAATERVRGKFAGRVQLPAGGAYASSPGAVNTLTVTGGGQSGGELTLNAGSSPVSGLPSESPALTPLPKGGANAYSANVVGYVNKTFDAKPATSAAVRESQVYLPSTEASPGTPGLAGVQERMEKTPQLGVPLQGGGRGGGGPGGHSVALGYGEFAAKGVTLDADFSGGDQLVARTTQPEGTLRKNGQAGYGFSLLGPSEGKTSQPQSEVAAIVKPGSEVNRNASTATFGVLAFGEHDGKAIRGTERLSLRNSAGLPATQPPPPAATAGTLTINEGAVSDNFTKRTDGDTAKVPVVGDVPVLGRAFGNKPAAPATADSGRLSYNGQSQYRRLNQSGTELAAVEPTQEKFYAGQGQYAGGPVKATNGSTGMGGVDLAFAPQGQIRGYYSDAGFTAGDTKAPTKPVEGFGRIVLPEVAGGGKQIEVANGTSRVVPSRSLRGPGISGGVRVNDALTRDGRLLLEEGRIAEAEERFKGALKVDPQNRAAGYYLALTDEARQKEVRLRQSETTTAGVNAVGVATPLLEAATVREILARKIDGEARLLGREEMLKKLKSLSPEELREVLPKTVPDSTLTGLITDLNGAERRLAELKKNQSANDPDVLRTQVLVNDLKQKTDKSTTALIAALESQVNGTRAEVAKLNQALESEKKADLAKVEQNRAYFDKKRELDSLLSFRRILETKIASEKVDVGLPKTTMIEIVDRAEPPSEKQSSFLGGLFGKSTSQAVARVKVERDVSEIQGFTERQPFGVYDPQFVQTEVDAIESEAVLGKVVDQLKLDQTWAKDHGGKLDKKKAIKLLKSKLDLNPVRNTSLVEIQAKSEQPEEAARLANAVAEAYRDYRKEQRHGLTVAGVKALEERYAEHERKIAQVEQDMARMQRGSIVERNLDQADLPIRKPSTNAPIPQPEIQTSENIFSTFSLNVSDVSFKLAAASLEKGQMPDAASVRSEEFINAFDYRDPEPVAGAPIAFAWERARYPFAHNRDLLRFSLKTAAAGRQAGRPLNLVLLLDNSGSMERADRVRIIREALRVLASQLQAQDKLSVVTFSRTPRLFADGVSGDKAGEIAEQVGGLTPQGGTNLEDAMNLAYRTALKHYSANGINRLVVLTDGAANLGNVEPESLKQKVEAYRKQGIALDCFGIGWEGYNDDLLEVLSRNGDGRYGFINSPEEAATEFAGQLAGALKVAASDVKVQVEFNPKRVTAYRQIGYAKHQLTKEQFRDNTVDAAEIAAQEAGNALYTVEVNPAGQGPLCTVRVRFKIPGTMDYREQAWDVPYTGNALSLEQSSPAMRLAASASAFSEWLVASPFAAEVTPDRLLGYLSGVPGVYGADSRPKKLEWMIRQAKSVVGK